MIGVFDSGYGGLSVFQAITKKLPEYSYVYLSDNNRAPYGSRSEEEIIRYTWQGVEHLYALGCNLVILACNTSSARALRAIQQEILPETYPRRKVLGIIVPTIEQVVLANKECEIGMTVGVLATEHTVQSRVYETEIQKRSPRINVVQQSCPLLAPAIEKGNLDVELENYIDTYISMLMRKSKYIHAIVLGCTHYDLIANSIKKKIPLSVHVYRQPDIVASSLGRYLESHPEIEVQRGGDRHFFTTGNPLRISSLAATYMQESVSFLSVKRSIV